MKVLGYIRSDGRVGVRNHVVILPTVICSRVVAERISEIVGAVCIDNQHGCGQIGADLEQTERTLIGIGGNPNVAAVLVVGLGCEAVRPERVADKIATTGKLVEHIVIQDLGGTLKAMERGVSITRKFIQEVSKLRREEVDISNITLALECGGSDATSGFVANPVAGYVADKLIDLGGRVVFSETTEVIGAEHLLAKRAVSREVAEKLLEVVRRVEEKAKSMKVDLLGGNPSPGNIKGGITTIEEKSLGAIYKAGTKPLQGVLDYAEPIPSKSGLYFMDTPGQDIESIVGMLAGGAQIVIFTTGRGTPTGSPIAPVIKITGNPETYKLMEENIDFYAAVIEGKETIQEAGERLFNEMIEVINGKPTKAEALKQWEFAIHKLVSTF
ncbi:MAG: UxaA family hydrolase [archaeon YNP-LCB-024-027]|nr:UxaA family hydrolase [Candidatus Culexarchaeum yellowstonense]